MSRILERQSALGRRDLAALIECLLVTELTCPGDEFWLVCDSLGNAPVVDNTGGVWAGLEPAWFLEEVPLQEVLVSLLRAGLGRLEIATLSGQEEFLQEFDNRVRDAGLAHRLSVRARPVLETRGIVAHAGCLDGRLDFREDGVAFGGSAVRFDASTSKRARLLEAFKRDYVG